MAGERKIEIHILAEAKKALAGFKQAGDAADGFGSKVGKLAGKVGKAGLLLGGGLVTGAGAAGVALFSLSDDAARLQQNIAKANTVFGDSIKVVDDWAQKNAHAMGLTKNAATGVAASFGDLLIPMGFTREQAAKMSTDVVGLSGALSAWTGGQKSAEEVAHTLSKAMLGEREELKGLGISITEADVKQRLLEKGQKDLTGAALQQAEAIATQELIFEKSKDAQAAYADGTKTLAERQLELKAKFEEVKEKIVTALIPVYEKLMAWTSENWPIIEKISTTALNLIRDAAVWIYENVIPPLIDAFQAFRDWLKDHEAEINAVWQGFQAVMGELWDFAANYVWPGILAAIDKVRGWLGNVDDPGSNSGRMKQVFVSLRNIMADVWEIFKASWPHIQGLIGAAWTVISPILGLMVKVLEGIAKAAEWAIQKIKELTGVADKAKSAHDTRSLGASPAKSAHKASTGRNDTGDLDPASMGPDMLEYLFPGLLGKLNTGYAPGGKGFGGMVPTTEGVWNALSKRFEGETFLGGRAGRSWKSDHPTGHAFDVGGTRALMRAMADWLASNFGRMPLKYLIFDKQINYGKGWQAYRPSKALINSGADAWHTRHVHVSTYQRGGPVSGNGAQPAIVHGGEYVLTRGDTALMQQLVSAVKGGGREIRISVNTNDGLQIGRAVRSALVGI